MKNTTANQKGEMKMKATIPDMVWTVYRLPLSAAHRAVAIYQFEDETDAMEYASNRGFATDIRLSKHSPERWIESRSCVVRKAGVPFKKSSKKGA